MSDYFDTNDTQMKSHEQWGDWEESSYSNTTNNNRYQQSYPANDRRRQQQQQQHHQHQQKSSEDLAQKSTRYNEQNTDFNRTKPMTKTKPNTSRTLDSSSSVSTKLETTKPVTNKAQPAWRPLSPPRPPETNDPTPQEAITYKSQIRTNDMIDRRQTAPVERKSRYTTSTTPIDTASIPPLMSVRSDVPPSTVTTVTNSTASKHFKTSNQSQRQDYNTSSHYSQRNDFYTDTNDSGWGNDDEYYDDETGYYDGNLQTHQRHTQSVGYHAHSHHRGYTTLGSYGRYRRGGTLRHQQQYTTYPANASSQLNTSTGSKTKKTSTNRTTNKKLNESSETIKPVEEPTKIMSDETAKKPAAWSTEPKASSLEEIPIFKTIDTPALPLVIEKSKEIPVEQKPDNESNVLGQIETDSTTPNKKFTTSTTASNNAQKKSNRDQQNYYQNQQAPRHRSTYARSAQGKRRFLRSFEFLFVNLSF